MTFATLLELWKFGDIKTLTYIRYKIQWQYSTGSLLYRKEM